MWKKYLGNEGGYALVIAVLAITMITILGLSVLATTTHSKNSVVKEDNNQTAYYIAEAGLNLKKADLQEIEKIYDEFQKEILAEQQNAINANKDVPKMTSAQFIAAFKARVATKLNTVTAKTYYASSDSQCTGKTNCTKVLERENSMATVTTEAVITDTNFTYKINSVGSVNQQTRKIATTLSYALDAKAYKEKVVADSFSKYAIHATGTLTIKQGTVTGPLGFKSTYTEAKKQYLEINSDKDKSPDKQVDGNIDKAKFPFGSESADSKIVIKPTSGTERTYWGCKPSNQNDCLKEEATYLKKAEDAKDIVFKDTEFPILPTFPYNEFPIDISEANYWDGNTPTKNKLTNTTLNGNYTVSMSDLNSLNNIIDIGNNVVNLYFPSGFNLNNNVLLNIKGSGTINIHTNTFNLTNNNSINFNNNKVTIISKDKFLTANSAALTTSNSLTIKAPSLSIEGSSSIHAGGNINILNVDSLSLDNSAKLSSESSLKISANTITSKNESSISAKEAINMFIQKKVDFNNKNKIIVANGTTQANIYYTGTEQTTFQNEFNNKVNFDSLYSGIIFDNAASIDGTIFVRNDFPKNGVSINKDISFYNNTGNVKGPSYVYAPNSNIRVKQAQISGSLIGKNVLIDTQASVTFIPKTSANSSTPGSNELEEITDGSAGKITSSFTNKSSGGSIEVD